MTRPRRSPKKTCGSEKQRTPRGSGPQHHPALRGPRAPASGMSTCRPADAQSNGQQTAAFETAAARRAQPGRRRPRSRGRFEPVDDVNRTIDEPRPEHVTPPARRSRRRPRRARGSRSRLPPRGDGPERTTPPRCTRSFRDRSLGQGLPLDGVFAAHSRRSRFGREDHAMRQHDACDGLHVLGNHVVAPERHGSRLGRRARFPRVDSLQRQQRAVARVTKNQRRTLRRALLDVDGLAASIAPTRSSRSATASSWSSGGAVCPAPRACSPPRRTAGTRGQARRKAVELRLGKPDTSPRTRSDSASRRRRTAGRASRSRRRS